MHPPAYRTIQSPSCGRVHAAHMHAPTGPDNEKIRTMKRFDCTEFGSAHIHAPTGPAPASARFGGRSLASRCGGAVWMQARR